MSVLYVGVRLIMTEEEQRFKLPPFEQWVGDPEINSDKVIALTAVGLLSSIMDVSDAKAYEYVRSYAAAAASEMGFDINYRR
jgi:hypothetical protein